ncbi:hypothetical protein, partial [Nocardiopsis sp. LOL_012]|uniref:hypothetical protein n=1 Tax=Nocardiopsis sp. LOL_012 TaxID=3345409 RepID=UPI003A845188
TDTALTGINTLRNHPPHTTNSTENPTNTDTDSGRTPATQNPASARTTHNSPSSPNSPNSPNSQSPNTQNQDHNTNPEDNPYLDGFTDELNTRPATPSDAPDTANSGATSPPDLYDTPPATPRTAPSPLQGPL